MRVVRAWPVMLEYARYVAIYSGRRRNSRETRFISGGQIIVDSLIGTSIGGYVLISALGSGGMGTVYLAEDPAIGQHVAIKVVRSDPDSLTDLGVLSLAAERFKQ